MNPQPGPFTPNPTHTEPVAILVVDDEEMPRRCFVAILERLGYQPEAAVSAKDALARFDRRKHRLVLTDHRMPGMSGAELAEQIKTLSPTTPILMCSGHSPSGPMQIDAFLDKPFSVSDLRTTLGLLLATTSTSLNDCRSSVGGAG